MDIFKIRLNKALSSNRIGKLEEFLLKEGQVEWDERGDIMNSLPQLLD